jgi:hypothetical protein
MLTMRGNFTSDVFESFGFDTKYLL